MSKHLWLSSPRSVEEKVAAIDHAHSIAGLSLRDYMTWRERAADTRVIDMFTRKYSDNKKLTTGLVVVTKGGRWLEHGRFFEGVVLHGDTQSLLVQQYDTKGVLRRPDKHNATEYLDRWAMWSGPNIYLKLSREKNTVRVSMELFGESFGHLDADGNPQERDDVYTWGSVIDQNHAGPALRVIGMNWLKNMLDHGNDEGWSSPRAGLERLGLETVERLIGRGW